MAGSIPFSVFVDITTSTVRPAATFGRLNAIVATNNNKGERFEEFNTVNDVITRYGVGSPQAEYADTFFGYSSKTATKAQKLTFYNWRQEAKPYSITSGQLTDSYLNNLKVNGVLRVKIKDTITDVQCDLTTVVNYADVANKLNQALQTAMPDALWVVNYDTDNQKIVMQASKDEIEFLVNDDITTDLYSGTLSNSVTNIKPPITINETGNFEFSGTLEYGKKLTATTTLKVLMNDTIEVYSKELVVNTATNTFPTFPLTIDPTTTAKSEYKKVDIVNLKVDKPGFTIKNAKLVYKEAPANDLYELLLLQLESGAKIEEYDEALPLTDAIDDICLINGDYVTISFDSSVKMGDTPTELTQVLDVINKYPLSRFYLVACMSDASIEYLKNLDMWEKIMSTEGLIATRVYDGKHTYINAYVQAIIAAIDYGVANGALNINFLDAAGYEDDAIRTPALLDQCNKDRVNTVYITGGYGNTLTLFGEGHIMGKTFQTLSVALGETYIKAQLQVQGINVLTGASLISLRGKSGQGQVLTVFSSVLQAATVSGIIVQGATLTQAEISTITQLTGIADIADLVSTNGWYVQIDPITDEHITNKTIPVTFVYVANIPTNRIQARSFVIGA